MDQTKKKKLNTKYIKKNYFFEQDLIFQICQKKIKIHQVKSEVLYQNETSSLKIVKIIIPFTIYDCHYFQARGRLSSLARGTILMDFL